MNERELVNVVYTALVVLLVWVTSFTVIAAYVARRRTWIILAALVASVLLFISSILVYRSPLAAEWVKLILLWLQRFGIVTTVISLIWLVFYLMRLENGRLASVYDAMTLAPLRRKFRPGAAAEQEVVP